MRVVRTVAEMREIRRCISGTVGLVATLGGIHVGHTTHMDVVRPKCDVLVGSLFLNPTQFGENEDLSSYPSDEATDIAEFEMHGVDFLFAPSVDEMYPADESVAKVDPGPVAKLLEGAHRPGHFDGVATVVARLFSVVSPDMATFGEKDAQQLRIIRHVNDSLGFGIEIIPIPTVRESDGLAVSSRNAYLTHVERKAAAVLYAALSTANDQWNSGERSAAEIRNAMSAVLTDEPLADVEYVAIVDPDTFEELGQIESQALALLAVRIGNARLIDNLLLA